jgi:hypothetical protein
MEKEDRDTMRRISETLDAILAVLLKPQNRFMRILDTMATGITIISIISIFDIIKKWIGG